MTKAVSNSVICYIKALLSFSLNCSSHEILSPPLNTIRVRYKKIAAISLMVLGADTLFHYSDLLHGLSAECINKN